MGRVFLVGGVYNGKSGVIGDSGTDCVSGNLRALDILFNFLERDYFTNSRKVLFERCFVEWCYYCDIYDINWNKYIRCDDLYIVFPLERISFYKDNLVKIMKRGWVERYFLDRYGCISESILYNFYNKEHLFFRRVFSKRSNVVFAEDRLMVKEVVSAYLGKA